jgi:hypothetical protein
MKVSIGKFMAPGREEAVCSKELRALYIDKTLNGHLYWFIMGDEPERVRMLCYPDH